MTGAPMPTDAMSRMQMAPDVYNFTKNFARKPNLFEKTGNLVKNIGRNTLVGAGLLAGMDLENQQRQQQELMRNEADKAQSEAVTMDDPVKEVAPEPMTAGERMIQGKLKLINRQAEVDQATRDDVQAKAIELINLKKQDLVDKPIKGSYTRTKMIKTDPPQYEEEVIDPFPQEPTTADSYGQDYVPNQTATNIVDRKITQGSQIADSTPNIAEVLSENQDSQPPEGMVGGEGKNQLAKFLSQKGLDQALLGAIGERMTPEPRIGDSSPLVDHPDLPGGEDDINLPSGTNTSPTTDLKDHYSEMRRMDAEERRGKPKIDRRVGKNLLEQRAEANEQAMGSMRLSDEEREKESIRLGSTGGIPNKTDMAKIRKSPEFIAAQESMKPKSTSEKSDDFMDKLVRDAKMEVESQQPQFSTQVDSRKYKEVGINQLGDLYTTYQSDPNRRYSYQTDPRDTEEFTKLIQSGDLGSKPSLLVDAMISRVKKYKEGEQGFTKL
jgi:hypothetical protein